MQRLGPRGQQDEAGDGGLAGGNPWGYCPAEAVPGDKYPAVIDSAVRAQNMQREGGVVDVLVDHREVRVGLDFRGVGEGDFVEAQYGNAKTGEAPRHIFK